MDKTATSEERLNPFENRAGFKQSAYTRNPLPWVLIPLKTGRGSNIIAPSYLIDLSLNPFENRAGFKRDVRTHVR